MINLSIDKEIVAEMPMVQYHGTVHVIDTEEQAIEALALLNREACLGFDTETRPTFRRGVSHTVALIQIATATDSYLFRINKMGFIAPLRQLLESADVMKIGLSVKDDFHGLRKLSENLEPANFIELQNYVREFGIIDASLQKVFAIIFEQRISKGQRLSNWEAKELTDAQQHYASIDAWACLEIYNTLNAGLFHPEQSPYIAPEPEPETEQE